MVRVTVAVWVLPPPVPVTAKVLVPVVAPSRTAMVIVDVPEPPAIEVGLKVAVTPLGSPDADKETLELKLPEGVTVIVELPELTQVKLNELGDAPIVKSPLPPPPPVVEMVKLTVVVAVRTPLVPVTVIV
jgi:hypothetical protein